MTVAAPIKLNIRLHPIAHAQARLIGDGNVSLGIRRALQAAMDAALAQADRATAPFDQERVRLWD